MKCTVGERREMKILRSSKEWSKEITCDGCWCKYIADFQDLRFSEQIPTFDRDVFVLCPECGHVEEIDEANELEILESKYPTTVK